MKGVVLAVTAPFYIWADTQSKGANRCGKFSLASVFVIALRII